jgi:predicted signal transduction protein with EAL and GGDEF domain
MYFLKYLGTYRCRTISLRFKPQKSICMGLERTNTLINHMYSCSETYVRYQHTLSLWLCSSWKLSYAHLYLRLGVWFFFVITVTLCIVVLFHLRIRADLLLRNASFRTFICFRRTLCCYLE